jgi:hypothetical protein
VTGSPVEVRAYAGRTRAEAAARLAEDEEPMAAAGYTLASQEWTETIRYGVTSKVLLAIGALCTAGGWLIAPPLSIIAMVFLVIGVLTRTRTGELTVTWTRAGVGGRIGSDRAPS